MRFVLPVTLLCLLISGPRAASPQCRPHPLQRAVLEAALTGRSEEAIQAAAALAEEVGPEESATCPVLAGAPAYLHLTLARFGRWEELLERSEPGEGLEVARALARYARGLALAAMGRWDDARAALYALRLTAYEGTGRRDPLVQIAVHSLGGELSLRHGQAGDAVELFRRAVRLRDALPEPDVAWPYTPRHRLGWALLAAGRPAEAESTFRAALDRRPGDGWALYGLMRALETRGREAEASEVRQRFERVWRDSDTRPEAFGHGSRRENR